MLTREQIAKRTARELEPGQSVQLDEGGARLLTGQLPDGVRLVGAGEPNVDIAVVTASQVANSGEFAGSAPGDAKRVIAVLERHHGTDGARVLARCETVAGRANLVITDLAVFEVTPQGLVLREVAPGVSALDVQLQSDTPLLASDDLKVIDV